jgi:hypothetical protein
VGFFWRARLGSRGERGGIWCKEAEAASPALNGLQPDWRGIMITRRGKVTDGAIIKVRLERQEWRDMDTDMLARLEWSIDQNRLGFGGCSTWQGWHVTSGASVVRV